MDPTLRIIIAFAILGGLALFFFVGWLSRLSIRRKSYQEGLKVTSTEEKPTTFSPTDPLPSEQIRFATPRIGSTVARARITPRPSPAPVDKPGKQALSGMFVTIVRAEKGEATGRFKVVYPAASDKDPAFFSTHKRGNELLRRAMAEGLMVGAAAWQTLAEITENGDVE